MTYLLCTSDRPLPVNPCDLDPASLTRVAVVDTEDEVPGAWQANVERRRCENPLQNPDPASVTYKLRDDGSWGLHCMSGGA